MTTERPTPDQLSAFPLFRGLSPDELRIIAGCMDRMRLPAAGYVLFETGDEANGAYLVAQGGLRLLLRSEDKDLVIAQLGPGTVVGELSLIENAPRSLRASATESTVLLFLDGERFEKLRARQEAAAYKVIRNICLTVCGRLRNTNTFIESELRGRRAMVVESHALAGTTTPTPEEPKAKARGFLARLFGGRS